MRDDGEDVSPNGAFRSGLWYMSLDGLITRDYNYIIENQEPADPHKMLEGETLDPCDWPMIAASTLPHLALYLPLCDDLEPLLKKCQGGGRRKQISPIYFAIEGSEKICKTITEAELEFNQVGDYWGKIFATHSYEKAEQHAKDFFQAPSPDST
ncbi:hypothetical protein B0H17DRAFT_1206919 [Mycena rosella]|uniref:Uncharacterized protein n=1 Tax=Mycena rosella TaxID=1033263 RepID=A0AAD7GCF6_MYCRO|nr:hypothetical protein B0H17DRAFT_1206919 [Mycena rosella]